MLKVVKYFAQYIPTFDKKMGEEAVKEKYIICITLNCK